MNNPLEDKRSHVVPKWFEYHKAIGKGELSVPRNIPFEINRKTKERIRTDLEEFIAIPTPDMACRLMGAGIILGDSQLSHDMAVFIAKKGGVDPFSIKLADKILNASNEVENISEIDIHISNLKKWVSEYPKSAIGWIDLSRAYTVKGQIQKAARAAIIALQLAPYDRFIVRCAVRLFLHIGDYDRAFHYIVKASKHHFDPWIKATEINVALISKNKVSNVAKFIPDDLSYAQLFHFSELIESYGSIELDSGNDRKARKQLRLAWKNPSDSVITHAEWILRNKLPGLREETVLPFDRSPEARTWINYVDMKLEKSLEAVVEWELEEPYSKYPFIVGSCIACDAGKPALGAKIAERGLKVASDNIVIYNNLCYALLRAGNVTDAMKYIDKLRVKNGTDSDLCCEATLGLYEYKKKNVTKGRKAYLEVINKCKQKMNYDMQKAAILNFILAELEAATPESEMLAIKALKNTDTINPPNVNLLRNMVQNKLSTLHQFTPPKVRKKIDRDLDFMTTLIR